MKFKQLTSILLIVFLLLINTSCEKQYPDGPLISMYSRKDRVTGTWTFEKVVINDENKTEDYRDMWIDITGNGAFAWNLKSSQYWSPEYIYGTWKFTDSEKHLAMEEDPATSTDTIYLNFDWRIMRLTYRELNLEQCTENGDCIKWNLYKY